MQIFLAYRCAIAYDGLSIQWLIDSMEQSMGAQPSKAVKEALKEILNGLSVAEAAKRAGCDTSAIYRNKEYQKHVQKKKGNKP